MKNRYKFILNSDYGINSINNISLKKIIEEFSIPDRIMIEIEKDQISIEIKLEYEDINLKILTTINFYVGTKIPEFQTLSFIVKKLYLNKTEYITEGEDIRTALSKIKKYLIKNNKTIDFEYKEDKYFGEYNFDNSNLTIFIEKFNHKKYIDGIYIDLPYKDNPDIAKIIEILKLNILDFSIL